MKIRSLGNQGLTVPVIGLGCMGMTGFEEGNMYGPADEKEAIATIHRSFELGGNFLDTATKHFEGEQRQKAGCRSMAAWKEVKQPGAGLKCTIQFRGWK